MFGRQKYPQWDYNRKFGLGYLRLEKAGSSRAISKTQQVHANNVTLLIDYDAAGNIVGVEVMGE